MASPPSEHDRLPWAQIESYLDRALELEPQACEHWLAELSLTKPDVADTVRSLLARREELNAAGFLSGTIFPNVAGLMPALREMLAKPASRETGQHDGRMPVPDFAEGDIVGRYRLIREIARGGMSSVWLAERCDGQLQRAVALKLPLIGPRMHFERFLRERDMLATLTHQNIASLYDAGFSDGGQPYLAMEYVDGAALTYSCDRQRLTTRERLALFMQVLQAVEFAHAKLIIHRDLKPSNILVTPQGRVVLLDFGIGKLLSDDTAPDTHLTQIAGRPFTPDYASPEQVAGEPLGTASDIYSLGVVLYELLTGARPYRLRNESRAAFEEAVLSRAPRRPSQSGITADVAEARSTSLRALTRTLAGDLDTIILKALKKNPSERYASVTALAQDIVDYLHSRPIGARPDSLWYRAGRFTARYKVQVAALAVAVVALISGAAIAMWQGTKAAAERDRAVVLASRNEAVTEFLGRMMTDAAASPTPITVSELLTRSERLAVNDPSSSPENRAAVLEMIGNRYASQDELEHAERIYGTALQLVSASTDRSLRTRLTCKYAQTTADVGRSAASIETITREIEQPGVEPDTASRCLLNLSTIFYAEQRGEEGVRAAMRGLALVHDSGKGSGVIEATLLGAAAFGNHLNRRETEAERYFDASLRKFKELGREHTDSALNVLNDWGTAVLAAGAPRRGLSILDETLRLELQREPDAEPSTTVVGNRALALTALGRFDQARPAFEQECRLSTQRHDEYGELHCLLGYASLFSLTTDYDEMQRRLDSAAKILNGAPAEAVPMRLLAVLQGRLALARGHAEEARAFFDRALVIRSANAITLGAALGKSGVALALNDPAQAVLDAQFGIQLATELQGDLPHSIHTALATLTLGRAYLQLGDRARAHEAFATSVENYSNTVDANHPQLLEARQRMQETQT